VNFDKPGLYRQPILVDGKTQGWLTFEPLRKLRSTQDVDFLRQQTQSFLLTSLLILLAAGLLGYLLARHLTKPLIKLKHAVTELSQGNFAIRVPANGRDEIADLSTDVNTLANTLSENLTSRQRWIADISHELRTPLSIIQGEIEALRDGVREVTPQSISSLHEEVTRLGKLINDLHELSMSDAGALNYKFEPVDLAALVSAEISKFSPQSEQRNLTISLRNSLSGTQRILADELRISQLVNNLIENSLRYTDAGGQIVIELSVRPNTVVLAVTDTAPSVSIDDCNKLFDRLYRVDGSRSRASGGSGLGLAIVKNIANAHRGTVSAAPSRIGGLAVTVEFPR
jgi:two-component system sensor histidine kinase BaeS